MQYLIKIVVSTLLIVAISEAARKNQLWGALIASLPITTLIALSWYYYETGSKPQTAALAIQIFYLLLPSLAFFAVFPWLLRKDYSFIFSLVAGSGVTITAYYLFIRISGLFR